MRSATAALVSLAIAALLLFAMCSRREKPDMAPELKAALAKDEVVQVARLGLGGAEPLGWAGLRALFRKRNPGYDVEWHPGARELPAAESTRIAFVQAGTARGEVRGAETESELGLGDIVVLRQGHSLAADAPLDFVVFVVPEAPGASVPAVIRPDWDPKITDTPGGCATDPGAYRRLLLTWDPARGPYVFHKLNAHRIRADDSFTHYHPREGGFDELYLVQEAPPGSKFLFSYGGELLKEPEKVTRSQAADLMRTRQHMAVEEAEETNQAAIVPSLLPGDLILIPRGVVHRGLGGIVAQIIAVPGFVPRAEIGVDDALKAINDNLALKGPNRLPYHEK